MKLLLIISAIMVVIFSAFTPRKKSKLKLPDEFVRVPGGTYSAGANEDSCYHCPGKRVSVMGFYISKYEVSNLQYRQFFAETILGLTEAERNLLIVDSTAWNRGPLRFCEPMTGGSHYHRHPAFNHFPVVNITYEAALKYCQWLQQKLQKENPAFELQVQLPTKQQWTWAAGAARSGAMYPWVASDRLIDKKRGYMCNFKIVGDDAITKNSDTGLPEIKLDPGGGNFLMPVKSFYPSEWGLYNMSGNAAEMVIEQDTCMGGSWDDYGGDVTVRSAANYKGPSPTVGFRPIIIAREKTK